jgi:amidohydrolase
MTNLNDELSAVSSRMVAVRRDLHVHPELGFQEMRTAKKIAERLRELSFDVKENVAVTGVVGEIRGRGKGKVVLARFDMDALPIQEATGVEYASQMPGVMHACGHDGHVAIGLAVAEMLSYKRDFAGTVRLVFQPAEEGLGGAEKMIAEGVLSDPVPDVCFALHLWNEKPLGWLGIHAGPLMAGSEIVRIKIVGKGGHGAMPDTTADPIAAAAQVIIGLQTIVARNIPPLDGAVVSITTIHGGDAHNVIPGQVELSGTIRFFKKEVQSVINLRLEEIVHGISQAMGCKAEIELLELTPPVVNAKDAADIVQAAARRLFPETTNDEDYRVMGSEDMAFMLQKVKGCYFLVGSQNRSTGKVFSHHHPQFDFDEDAMLVGAQIMTDTILDFLNTK